MATIERFQDIEAWQKARELSRAIYSCSSQGSFARDFGLRDQIRKATVSIISNIAEGFERSGSAEFLQFLSIAKGSAGEVEAQLYVALDQGYIAEKDFRDLQQLTISIKKLLAGFMGYLKESTIRGSKFKTKNQRPKTRDYKPETINQKQETKDHKPTTTNHRLKTRNQNGLALITAMLIVAIVATVAAYLSLGQQVWLRQSQNFADLAQAEAIRSGALHWAMLILIDDAKNSATDDLTEDWAQQLPPLPAEGGVVVGAIEDAQGRFNLNNVLRNNKPSAEDIGVFQRLLRAQSLESGLVDALVDWLDSDSKARPNGGEDIDYLNTEPAYRTANQRLHSVDELRLIKGFDAEAVSKLRPYVTVLPQATEININTAPAAVLSALFVELPMAAADELAADLKKNPLKSANDLKKRLPAKQALPKVSYGVKSAYFEVSVATQFGRLQRQYTALVHRPAGASVEILWQEQRLPVIDKSEDTEQQADQSGA